MRTGKYNLGIVLLMGSLLVAGIVVLASANRSSLQKAQLADPPAGTVTPQRTPNPTEGIPSATANATGPPTLPIASQTPPPTIVVMEAPSVVAQETIVWQGPTPDPTRVARANRDAYLAQRLFRDPATPVAAGTNRTLVPDAHYTGLTLTTYQIEEVTFPEPMTWTTHLPGLQGGLDLRSVTFSSAWRVTIKGEGFVVGNSPWIMWINDRPIGSAETVIGGLTAIVYDRSLLLDGAKLGVSLGFGSLTYLPEAVHLPPSPSPTAAPTP